MMNMDCLRLKDRFFELMGVLSIEEIIMNRDLGPVLERISRIVLALNENTQPRRRAR